VREFASTSPVSHYSIHFRGPPQDFEAEETQVVCQCKLQPRNRRIQGRLSRRHRQLLGVESLDQSRENDRGIGYWTVAASSFWCCPPLDTITGATVHFQRQGVGSSCRDWCCYPAIHQCMSARGPSTESEKISILTHCNTVCNPLVSPEKYTRYTVVF